MLISEMRKERYKQDEKEKNWHDITNEIQSTTSLRKQKKGM